MTNNPIFEAALKAAADVATGFALKLSPNAAFTANHIAKMIEALPVPDLRETLAGMVRKLEWEPWDHGRCQAKSIFGTYSVWENFWRAPDDYGGKYADDPLAAAQADYAARILAGLDMGD